MNVKLKKPIASLVSALLLSLGMVTMAATTASAHTNHWSGSGDYNGWSRWGDDERSTSTPTSAPSGYVVAAWYMPGWVNSSTAVWQPGGQKLATSIKVSTKDLGALDAWVKSQSYGCFQIDGYNDNSTTTALLGGKVLYAPNNPSESLWGGGLGSAWKFTKVGTSCTPPVTTKVTPVAPTVAPQTCQVGTGGVSDLTGGSITLPTTAGVTYTVSGGKTTGLAAGDYTITATPGAGTTLSVTGTDWKLQSGGVATLTVTVAAAADCSVSQPQPKVTTTAWVDGTWACDDTTVKQTREVTTTPYVWSNGGWVLDATSASTVTETQTRDLLASEQTVCSQVLAAPPNTVVTIVPPTCTADGSATLADGVGYTWDKTSFGPGTWTATATVTDGYAFDHGTTAQVTFTVAPKLTGSACTFSEVLAAPPNASVPTASSGVLAFTGATPLPLVIVALLLLGGGALLQPRIRRAVFSRR